MNIEKIKELMFERKVMQMDLASAIGVSQAFICNMLKGLNEPSLKVAKRIADFFDCTIDELL